MASATSVEKMQELSNPAPSNQAELEKLAEDFFLIAEAQLSKMTPDKRKTVLASIHATAESLRAEK